VIEELLGVPVGSEKEGLGCTFGLIFMLIAIYCTSKVLPPCAIKPHGACLHCITRELRQHLALHRVTPHSRRSVCS
jgi:hypothetical protein